jgi:hypothetical protein
MVRLGVAEDQPLAVQQWYYTTSLMLDRMIANVEDAGRV